MRTELADTGLDMVRAQSLFYSDVPKSPARRPTNSAVGRPERPQLQAILATRDGFPACIERELGRTSAVSRVDRNGGVHGPVRAVPRRTRGGLRRKSRQVAHEARLSIQRDR